FQVHERLRRGDAGYGPDGVVEQVQQVVVVGADQLGEQVVAAGAHDHVVDLGDGGDGVGDRPHVTGDLDADHDLAGEAQHQRVGDRDDLHHAAVQQSLYPL